MKEITIKIIYREYESRIMRRGSFSMNPKRFREDPDHEVARVAFARLHQFNREEYIKEIIEIVYNDDKDGTDIVKTLEKAPLD
jgi:hypothetical protein